MSVILVHLPYVSAGNAALPDLIICKIHQMGIMAEKKSIRYTIFASNLITGVDVLVELCSPARPQKKL